MSVHTAATRLAAQLQVDEDRDLVVWHTPDGQRRQTGFHDYAALYAVPGLYEAAYFVHLRGGSPQLLAGLLSDVVPAADRAARKVLDVGVGTGVVGECLADAGFTALAGTDLEPASIRAVRRDRPGLYRTLRTMDLTDLTDPDRQWLTEIAADVLICAGAVGYGHLPATALAALTALSPPGGLLAVTVSPALDSDPRLAGHAAVLRGPYWQRLAESRGVHRSTSDGRPLPALALVLQRTGQAP